MGSYLRPPDDVYWHFKRLALSKQVGSEYTSWEDGCLYRVNAERRICQVVGGEEQPTIDSLPLRQLAGARVMNGTGWGFRMHISTFYQQIIARTETKE